MGLLSLSGCLPAGSDTAPADPTPVRQVSLLEGRVHLRSPQGYCIDTSSLRDHARAGFALIAGCDGLAGLPSGTLVPPAILTVSALLSQGDTPDSADIARALGDETVLARARQGDLTLIQVDNPDLVPEGSAARHWRGAMVLNGAILTMAAYGTQTVSDSKGQALLIALARATQQASPAKSAPKP